MAATGKAKKSEAYTALSPEERAAIESAIRDVETVYNGSDHHLLNDKIEVLNRATQHLAENMMNTAVRGALKGTKID